MEPHGTLVCDATTDLLFPCATKPVSPEALEPPPFPIEKYDGNPLLGRDPQKQERTREGDRPD